MNDTSIKLTSPRLSGPVIIGGESDPEEPPEPWR